MLGGARSLDDHHNGAFFIRPPPDAHPQVKLRTWHAERSTVAANQPTSADL